MIDKFLTQDGKEYSLPLFFPDATRGVVRTLDSVDVRNTETQGILVNTYHLYQDLGSDLVEKFGGIRKFMNWDGAIISDSGGFQIMSLVKSESGAGIVKDIGIYFFPSKKKKFLLTPEKSIEYQIKLKTDLIVVLDDFTPPGASLEEAKDSVARTIRWAKRCRQYYEKFYKLRHGPYLIGVVQGGVYPKLRKYCTEKLIEIGFDGLGYGGWPINKEGNFDFTSAKIIANNSPKDFLLYGLGIGKPDDIVKLYKMGFQIFDCVLPTRDARHERLYVFNSNSMDEIDVNNDNFFKFYIPTKMVNIHSKDPVSFACDCLLCKNYSKAYFAHLFKIKDTSALRLATIHNLRFYSLLMEKLRDMPYKKV